MYPDGGSQLRKREREREDGAECKTGIAEHDHIATLVRREYALLPKEQESRRRKPSGDRPVRLNPRFERHKQEKPEHGRAHRTQIPTLGIFPCHLARRPDDGAEKSQEEERGLEASL